MEYKDGYKYQVFTTYEVPVAIQPQESLTIDTYLELDTNGTLRINKGYAWDGASGPAIDTKTIMRGSLIHDALYQLMRAGKLGQQWREQADKELRTACLRDGMWRIRAWWVYLAVRLFAKKAAMVGMEKRPKVAP